MEKRDKNFSPLNYHKKIKKVNHYKSDNVYIESLNTIIKE